MKVGDHVWYWARRYGEQPHKKHGIIKQIGVWWCDDAVYCGKAAKLGGERMKNRSIVKITSVSFRSSVQLKPFQHVHVEATAQVLPGQTADRVLDLLKTFVANELRRAKEGDVLPVAGRFRI